MTLKELRKKKGITATHIASVVGCSKQFISYMEDGKNTPNVLLAAKLAEEYGITLAEFAHLIEQNRK